MEDGEGSYMGDYDGSYEGGSYEGGDMDDDYAHMIGDDADDSDSGPVAGDQVDADCACISSSVPGVEARVLKLSASQRSVWLCISFKRLRLGSEYAIALGLNPAFPWIAFRIYFRSGYDTERHSDARPMVQPDAVIQVKDPAKLSPELKQDENHCRCGLAGLISHRLSLFLSGRLRDAAEAPASRELVQRNKHVSWVDLLFGFGRPRVAGGASAAAGEWGSSSASHGSASWGSSAASAAGGKPAADDLHRSTVGGFEGDLSRLLPGCKHTELLWPVKRSRAPEHATPDDIADDLATQLASESDQVGFSYAAIPRAVALGLSREHAREQKGGMGRPDMARQESSAEDEPSHGFATIPPPGQEAGSLDWAIRRDPEPGAAHRGGSARGDDPLVESLALAHPHVPEALVRLALHNCNRNSDAAEQLLGDAHKLSMLASANGIELPGELSAAATAAATGGGDHTGAPVLSAAEMDSYARVVMETCGAMAPELSLSVIKAALTGPPAMSADTIVSQVMDGRFDFKKYAQPPASSGAGNASSAPEGGAMQAVAALLGLSAKPEKLVREPSASSERSAGPAVHPLLVRTQLEPYLSTWNPLVSIYLFVEAVVQNAHRTCLSCGRPLAMSGMKPSICSSALCSHRYTELGLGMALDSMVLYQPQVMDLLISLFYSFLQHSKRKELRWDRDVIAQILVNAKEEAGSLAGSGAATGGAASMSSAAADDGSAGSSPGAGAIAAEIQAGKDRMAVLKGIGLEDAASQLIAALNACPSVGYMQMIAKREGLTGLLANLNRRHPLIAPILRMLVVDTPAHIRGLTLDGHGGEGLPGCDSCWTFVFKAGELQREAAFQDMKESRGSFFAFHGSHVANWHVILKTGLKNMSHTKYMSAGAAHGSGIYFANDAGTSTGYSVAGTTWPRSMLLCVPQAYAERPDAAAPGGPALPDPTGPRAEKNEKRFLKKYEDMNKLAPTGMGGSIALMALCELIPKKSDGSDYTKGGDAARGMATGAGFHVLKEESQVVTRYLLVGTQHIGFKPRDKAHVDRVRLLTDSMVAKVQV